MKSPLLPTALAAGALLFAAPGSAQELSLKLQRQVETGPGSGRFHALSQPASWQPAKTAIIVCDVWDYHHCLNAVRRLEEFVPRLNEVLQVARERGVTVIHSPSDCMPAYEGHAARQRALQTPTAAQLPLDVDLWCSRIPAEERAAYPIDQSDGGEDDDPQEHAAWAAKLQSLGRNPAMPWKKQSDLVVIDPDRDYISDRGDEVWNILENRGIENVILAGVHANMCVLGRPFGLRQMVRGGKNTVLLRDMTDCMYNPARWPYVSHFTGNDLVVSHVERFVCPTITSDQFLGGKPFRFSQDHRPRLAIIMAEDEYETARTLPEFASRRLGREFSVRYIFGSDVERNDIPGIEALAEADVALVSVRRRVLRSESLAIVRQFIAAGKPVVGIRTASHAFSLRDPQVPAGHEAWPEFDRGVWGGNYQGHYEEENSPKIDFTAPTAASPILAGVPAQSFVSKGALYRTSPLAPGAAVLLTGAIQGQAAEPVAWTFRRDDGGKSFYTSLGHKDDFDNPAFDRLLLNALRWAADLPTDADDAPPFGRAAYERHWAPIAVPGPLAAGSGGVLKGYRGPVWQRCVVRVPAACKGKSASLHLPNGLDGQAWCNGTKLKEEKKANASQGKFLSIPAEVLVAGDANLIVLRCEMRDDAAGFVEAPSLRGPSYISLAGRWQVRIGDDPSWSNMPLPAKFGAATDIVFELRP